MAKAQRVIVGSNERRPKGESRVNVRRGRTDPPVVCDRVTQFLESLNLVLRHHDAPRSVSESFMTQMTTYLTVDHEETFVKRAKYLVLLPMAIYLKNELPREPDLPLHFVGDWKKWSRPRLQQYSKQNTHLWYSFLQGKRGAAPVSKEIVLSNFYKHREQMLSPDPVQVDPESEGLKDRIMDLLEPLLDRLANQIHGDLVPFFEHPEREVHKASESASYGYSRKKGGQCGHLRDQIFMDCDEEFLRESESLHLLSHSIPHTEMDGVVQPNRTWSTRERPGELADLEQHLLDVVGSFSEPRVLNAQVEAVLEPLKVRTISKGEAVPYYLAKRVQKALHSRMRAIPAFRLIGRPFCPTDLMDLRNCQTKLKGSTLDECSWLSVDYSSATDGLSAALSAEILDRLLRDLAPINMRLYYLLKSVLAPHYIEYPPVLVKDENGDLMKVTVPSVDQQNGQLMGSILSFPVLCLANFGLYCAVRQEVRGRSSLDLLLKTVLINGDDCIYIGDHCEWESHQRLGALIGLAMSPGKAYIHKRYANINSQCVDFPLTSPVTLNDIERRLRYAESELECYNAHYSLASTYVQTDWFSRFEPPEEEQDLIIKIHTLEKRVSDLQLTLDLYRVNGCPETHPLEIPYFNVGLFRGNHKVLARVGAGDDETVEATKCPIISVMNRVIEGSLPRKRSDVFRLYVAFHREAIKRESCGRNLFLPVSLGGFGIKPIDGISVNITPSQRSLLIQKLDSSEHLVPLFRPLPPGREIPSVEEDLHDPIQVKRDPSEKQKFLPKRHLHSAEFRPEYYSVEWGLYRKKDRCLTL